VRFPVGKRILLFSQLSRLALRLIWPPIQEVQEAVNKGQKQRGCRGGHLLLRSTEVKNVLNYTYPNPHAFMVCTFTFGTHLIQLPSKPATENIYTASRVPSCYLFSFLPQKYQKTLKLVRKCIQNQPFHDGKLCQWVSGAGNDTPSDKELHCWENLKCFCTVQQNSPNTIFK
jgi:hypothetical protein